MKPRCGPMSICPQIDTTLVSTSGAPFTLPCVCKTARITRYARDNTTTILNARATRGENDVSGVLPPLQPVFAAGDVITWGDYASERGVAISNLEGLLVQACPFNASCPNGWLGNKACGRMWHHFCWSTVTRCGREHCSVFIN